MNIREMTSNMEREEEGEEQVRKTEGMRGRRREGMRERMREAGT